MAELYDAKDEMRAFEQGPMPLLDELRLEYKRTRLAAFRLAIEEVERLSVAAGILQKLVAHSAITRRPQFRAGLNADELAYLAAVAAGVETDREAQNDAH